jgi:dephospho-CoA kinase
MRHDGIRIIGLTGGVASGKSSVAHYFQERGLEVIDADQLARDAVEPGTQGLGCVVAKFGAQILGDDGRLDRKRLGGMIFSDPVKRACLEGILHPEIKRLAEKRIAESAGAGQKIVIYMAPLLIEAGATDRVDEIWVVTVRPDVQIERLMRRDGIERDAAECIIASQMPLVDKEKLGRVVIDNNGTAEETALQLAEIWNQEIEGKL